MTKIIKKPLSVLLALILIISMMFTMKTSVYAIGYDCNQLTIGNKLFSGDMLANYGTSINLYLCSEYTSATDYTLCPTESFNHVIIFNNVYTLSNTKPIWEVVGIDGDNIYLLGSDADTAAPSLTAGTVSRTSDSAATVKFTSDEAGTYYYAVVASGATKPTIATSGAGTSCTTSETTITISDLTAGAKDIYIVVKDSAGNVSSDEFKIAIPAYNPPHVPVTEITGVPTTATTGTALTLSGTVAPTNATNQTIVWTVKTDGGTNSTITGNSLTATNAGTVTITATITNGLTANSNYTEDFSITVNAAEINYTLYYNSADGKLYKDKGFTNLVPDTDYTGSYSGDGNVLTLNNFNFTTTEDRALSMLTGLNIILIGENMLSSTDVYGQGIMLYDVLTLEGDGSLAISAYCPVAAPKVSYFPNPNLITMASVNIDGSNAVSEGVFAIGGDSTFYYTLNDVPVEYIKFEIDSVDTYTVMFNSNDGSAVTDITEIESGAKISKPTDPTKAGYTFGGWYKEAALTNLWNFDTDTVIENTTLYAKWTAVSDSGNNPAPNPPCNYIPTPPTSSTATKPNIKVDVKPETNAPTTGINSSVDEIASSVFTADELKRINNGESAEVYITVEDISNTVSVEDKNIVEKTLENYNKTSGNDNLTLSMYIDISLFKEIGGSKTQMHETDGKIKIQIEIPEELRGNNKNYAIARLHEGVVEIISGTYDSETGLFTFETDRFSTYALLTEELATDGPHLEIIDEYDD